MAASRSRTGNNRGVQFDQYPSSWFDNVEVHLSPSATLLGQGLAGTVDMHTIRPLDKDKQAGRHQRHYIWDSLGQLAQGRGVSDKGYKVNGVWVDQFADHTFGVTLGIDLEQNPTPDPASGALGLSDRRRRQHGHRRFQELRHQRPVQPHRAADHPAVPAERTTSPARWT